MANQWLIHHNKESFGNHDLTKRFETGHLTAGIPEAWLPASICHSLIYFLSSSSALRTKQHVCLSLGCRCQSRLPSSGDDWASELLSKSSPATETSRLSKAQHRPTNRYFWSVREALYFIYQFIFPQRGHVRVESVLEVMNRVNMKSYYKAAITAVRPELLL